MRKIIVAVMLLSLLITTVVLAGGPELKPYGFLKSDMVYTSAGVTSFGGNNLSAIQKATGEEIAALGFTAQHSRFGLKGCVGEELKVGGRLELDFFCGGFDTNARPRLRLAYAWVKKGNLQFRFGQQWDLFSPNFPTTNNVNGFLWYLGNRGFRRGQIQMRYKLPLEGVAPMLQLSIGEAAKEAADLGADNLAVMPMIQGRVCTKFMEKYKVGLYFAYASFEPDPDTDDDEYTATGFGVDFNMPFHKLFALKGEFNTGTNLNNCNLFNIAGSGAKDDDRKSMGLWMNVTTKPYDKLHLTLGYGMDKNQTDDLTAGTTEQNTIIYGNVNIPIDHGFSVAVELGRITTSLKDVDDDNAANVFNIHGKISF